jgi:hypothetical protein
MSRASRSRPRSSADAASRLIAALACLAVATSAAAATRYRPDLRFRSIATAHFVIHFHQGLEPLAARLAVLAEDVHEELSRRMGHAPGGRTHVVLVDQDDVPNGWATPLPYNLIEITAAAPAGAALVGNTTDWLRLVFTHEYAHVLHLDRSRGWARAARALFGRTPFAFPNLTLPLWQIEGLATFEESTGGFGRLHAPDFRALVREAARENVFESIDRVNGGLVDWPGGQGWYAYGGFFQAYLAERYGRERLAELSDRTAGRFPYLTSGAYKRVFGRSLGELWSDFREAERQAAPTGSAWPDVRRVTFTGHVARGPRFDREHSILYTRSDPHGLPALERVSTRGAPTEVLASRIGGEHVTTTGEAIYFDQLELDRSVALTGDLYRLDRSTGDVTRLTNGARLADPDISPDGQRMAVVAVRNGRRDLLLLPQERLAELPRDALDRLPDCPAAVAAPCRVHGTASPGMYAAPRWSPDGRFVAVERRGGTGVADIVTIEGATGRERIIAAGGRNVTPAWAPDGQSLLFASDRDGPFDLYRAWLDAAGGTVIGLERLTRLPGGAHSPDVGPDGRSVAFVGYTVDGYDVFVLTLPDRPGPKKDREDFSVVSGHRDPPDSSSSLTPTLADAHRAPAYDPLPTLAPRAWLPVVEIEDDQLQVGAAVAGVDALGYHAWTAGITWPVVRPGEFSRFPRRADARLSYAYDRWRPTVIADVADETTWLLTGVGNAARQPFSMRDRSVGAGFVLPFRRVRWSQTAFAAWRFEHRAVETLSARSTGSRGALRAAWGISTAKRFGYSISPEDGFSAGVSLDVARPAFGADARGTFTRVDVRGYLPAVPRRGVIAVRASGIASRGERAGRRLLRVGGAGPDPGVLSFEEDATSLLRGFPDNAFQGDTAAVLNAEYRVPLGWPQRGYGTWPLFLRSLHATVFADAGHAWTGRFRTSEVKSSWGAEASADVVAGYALPLTWTAGVAWGRDGAGGVRSGREVYVRIGHGF